MGIIYLLQDTFSNNSLHSYVVRIVAYPPHQENWVIFMSKQLLNLETVIDFWIKLDIKPLMHLLEISIFSLNNVILRVPKIMNRTDKNQAHF